MAKAKFHSLRGEKSALIGISPNEFQFGNTFVYVSRAGVLKAIGKKDSDFEKDTNYWEDEHVFDIPDGYKIVPIVDEDGVIRTAKDGSELKTLVW